MQSNKSAFEKKIYFCTFYLKRDKGNMFHKSKAFGPLILPPLPLPLQKETWSTNYEQ